MFERKQLDMGIFKNSYGILFTFWLIFCTVCAYYYGKFHFDHINFEKSYLVIEELINKDIKKLEKQKWKNEHKESEGFNEASSQDSEGSISDHIDNVGIKFKISKRKDADKRMENVTAKLEKETNP